MANLPLLSKVDQIHTHDFIKPIKRIHDGVDVEFFLTSLAYRDIMTFMLQLNRSVLPRKTQVNGTEVLRTWPLEKSNEVYSDPVSRLRNMIASLEGMISDAPPETGPRRFGNVSFRTWTKLVQDKINLLFSEYFSSEIMLAQDELGAYLMGSFGSPQRLDYGTGHELSFLAFLGCLWKLGYFVTAEPGVEERGIVLGLFEPYLELIRNLIKTYNLEPAGSHGVWGLDDNSFLPYVFGSAQLSRPITETDDTPLEGSIHSAPDPASVVKSNLVDKEKESNMYFSAIAFIYDVKKGPFWEHSPILFDISGIKDGWGKINKGMIKMYNAEVLSKFPVVQHFPFGSLFRWEKDPEAKASISTTHTNHQPLRNPVDSNAPSTVRPTRAPGTGMPPMSQTAYPPPGAMDASTQAPWAGRTPAPPRGFVNGVTQAPWADRTPAPPPPRGGFNASSRAVRPLPKTSEEPGRKPQ